MNRENDFKICKLKSWGSCYRMIPLWEVKKFEL